MADFLLESGIDVNQDNGDALYCADKHIIEILKKNTPNYVNGLKIIDYITNIPGFNIIEFIEKSYIDDNLLINAASYNNINIVKYLVERGININIHNECALRQSTYNYYPEMTLYLLNTGANFKDYIENIITTSIYSLNIKNKFKDKIESKISKYDLFEFLVNNNISLSLYSDIIWNMALI